MPFDSVAINRAEIFNEATLYLVIYPVLGFLLVESDNDRYNIGWALIVLILGNIGINVLIMVSMTGKMLVAKCRARSCCSKKV